MYKVSVFHDIDEDSINIWLLEATFKDVPLLSIFRSFADIIFVSVPEKIDVSLPDVHSIAVLEPNS